MYIGAGFCMFLLRAWKIGQLERLAADPNKAPGELDVLYIQPRKAGLALSNGWLSHIPSTAKRIVELRRV